jgi:hypothetical protein
VIILDANGDLVGMNYSPNFEAPLRVPEDQVERFYRAYSDFTALLREPKYEFATRLSPGDVACFNNRFCILSYLAAWLSVALANCCFCSIGEYSMHARHSTRMQERGIYKEPMWTLMSTATDIELYSVALAPVKTY